ncbi:MAG: PorP/SprF family type IX secretion system membrane protein [Saprospiraceae bacterium]
MKLRHSLILIGFLYIQLSIAQDPIFTQYFNAPNFTNPAYTGADGGTKITLAYRNQWNRIPGLFHTKYLNLETYSPCLQSGFGLHLLHDEEGEGLLNTVSLGLDYNYHGIRINSENLIRVGFSAFWYQKWIDWDALIFSDQLHPKDGLLTTPSQAERLYNAQPGALGFKAGVLYTGELPTPGEDWPVELGIGISNLGSIRFDEYSLDGFYNTVPLDWRISISAGVIMPFTRYEGPGYLITVIPRLRFDMQSKIKVTTLGLSWHYNQFSLGTFYQNVTPVSGSQNTDAFILYAGYQMRIKEVAYDIGFSYDTNSIPAYSKSNLGGLTGGVFEVNLKCHLPNTSLFCRATKKIPRGAGKGDCPPVSQRHFDRFSW